MRARLALDFDKPFAKPVLRDAMAVVAWTDNEDFEDARRRIVDTAYLEDPDLAASLASSLDNDEARQSARQRIEHQKRKQQLMDAAGAPDEVRFATISPSGELVAIKVKNTLSIYRLPPVCDGPKKEHQE